MVDARPFLKWVGGKTSSLPFLLQHAPRQIGTYFEPMVGGGAFFWELRRLGRIEHAWLNDDNFELMLAYKAVRDHVENLIFHLKGMKNAKRFFLDQRARDPETMTPAQRAARTIYLNKTCFNGLTRVNKAGRFNVPFGGYDNPRICDEDNLRECSAALRLVDLTAASYAAVVAVARPGDLVYLDPPYVPLTETANFTAFTPGGWGRDAHERLARTFRRLADNGVAVMLSNSNTPLTRKLYRGFAIERTRVRRSVNSDGSKRGPVGEILVLANCESKTNHLDLAAE